MLPLAGNDLNTIDSHNRVEEIDQARCLRDVGWLLANAERSPHSRSMSRWHIVEGDVVNAAGASTVILLVLMLHLLQHENDVEHTDQIDWYANQN